jgi:sugar phosphate permease
MSSAFSGILSYGFMHLNTHGSGDNLGQHYGPTKANPTMPVGQQSGIAGWRWIFIMQGVLTCAIALIGFVTIIDFPEHAAKRWCGLQFLSKEESDFVVARIEKDRKDAIAEPFHLGKYVRGAADLKVWAFAAIFGLTTTITYAIAFFLPIILRDGMGFSVAMSQCLVAPPYVAAAIVMFGMAWAGDKWHIRSPFIITNAVLALIGKSVVTHRWY